jgi:hypothetical protein
MKIVVFWEESPSREIPVLYPEDGVSRLLKITGTYQPNYYGVASQNTITFKPLVVKNKACSYTCVFLQIRM